MELPLLPCVTKHTGKVFFKVEWLLLVTAVYTGIGYYYNVYDVITNTSIYVCVCTFISIMPKLQQISQKSLSDSKCSPV